MTHAHGVIYAHGVTHAHGVVAQAITLKATRIKKTEGINTRKR